MENNIKGLHRIADKANKYSRFAERLAKELPNHLVYIPIGQPTGRQMRFVLRQNGNLCEWEDVAETVESVSKSAKCRVVRPFVVG